MMYLGLFHNKGTDPTTIKLPIFSLLHSHIIKILFVLVSRIVCVSWRSTTPRFIYYFCVYYVTLGQAFMYIFDIWNMHLRVHGNFLIRSLSFRSFIRIYVTLYLHGRIICDLLAMVLAPLIVQALRGIFTLRTPNPVWMVGGVLMYWIHWVGF